MSPWMWLAIVLGGVPVLVGLAVARTLGVIAQRTSELYERESLFSGYEPRGAHGAIAGAGGRSRPGRDRPLPAHEQLAPASPSLH